MILKWTHLFLIFVFVSVERDIMTKNNNTADSTPTSVGGIGPTGRAGRPD